VSAPRDIPIHREELLGRNVARYGVEPSTPLVHAPARRIPVHRLPLRLEKACGADSGELP
jgi:hypothetical protein